MSGRLAMSGLGLLAGSSAFGLYGLVATGPEAAATLGATPAALAAIALAQPLLVLLALGAVVAAGLQRPRAAALAGGAVAAVAVTGAALAGTTWGLVALLALNALGLATALALHPALVARAAPADGQVRAFAAHFAAAAVALGAGAGLLAGLSGLTWRAGFLALGGLGALLLVPAVLARRRVEPARESDGGLALGFGEVARALMRVPTVRSLVAAQAALGAAAVPLLLVAAYFLEDRWSLAGGGRGGVMAAAALSAAVALALLAAEGDRRLASGPAALLAAGGTLLWVVAAALVGTAVAPAFGAAVALLAAAVAALALAQAAVWAALTTVVPATRHVHVGVLATAAGAGVGGSLGLLANADLIEDAGTTVALAMLAFPAAAAALCVRAAAATSAADLSAAEAAIAEEAEVRAAATAPPLLSCRGLELAYGHRRALDGIDLDVRQGELLALLGTNGAGKSTLLRVLSGLAAPDRGTVRLEGRDITLVDPERRARLGIGHMAAGSAVFDSLAVRESLRLAATSAGLDRARADEAVEWALARFARLEQRFDARVAELSGGERQMLALAQVLLRQPRLLLVDELSLGLAPGLVGQLLDVVRDAHAQGATVVMVEQSADVALGLATRAVFLERGRVRFDGDPRELHRRDDLLRPVFLRQGPGVRQAPAGGVR